MSPSDWKYLDKHSTENYNPSPFPLWTDHMFGSLHEIWTHIKWTEVYVWAFRPIKTNTGLIWQVLSKP